MEAAKEYKVTSQKTPFFIVTAVKTSNLTFLKSAKLVPSHKKLGPMKLISRSSIGEDST
jgi:hypothetical protein